MRPRLELRRLLAAEEVRECFVRRVDNMPRNIWFFQFSAVKAVLGEELHAIWMNGSLPNGNQRLLQLCGAANELPRLSNWDPN
jgi:hypothetical protein